MPSTEPDDLDGRLSEFRTQAVERRQRHVRSNVAAGALGLDLCTLGVLVLGVHGPARQLLGLAFCLVVPGWAIVGLLHLHDAALEAGLTVAASLASLVIVAQLAITFSAWHLTAVDVTVCLACLPSLLLQTLKGRQLPVPS